eukprot:6719849-Prorocentrum_lima.AAC.1
MGSNWRTRYFAARTTRIREEVIAKRLVVAYHTTKAMVADAPMKLSTGPALEMCRDVIGGEF